MNQQSSPIELAAKEYAENEKNEIVYKSRFQLSKSGFIAGSQWQAKQVEQPAKNEPTPERFKMPTDEQVIKFALVFNEGRIEKEKLADMVGFLQMVVDRLYENGDILIPSSKEK